MRTREPAPLVRTPRNYLDSLVWDGVHRLGGANAKGWLTTGASCDAEGQIRDEMDGGGNLDPVKVRAYLAAAGAVVDGAS